MAQISTKIPNPFIAGMVYWILLILIVGICVAGTGILAILIEIKVRNYIGKSVGMSLLTDEIQECCCHHLFWNTVRLLLYFCRAHMLLRCYLESYLEKRNY